MTPLQQAAQDTIERWDAPLNKVHMGMEALRKALADEKAQGVEPVLFIDADTLAMAAAHVGAWKPGHELDGNLPLYLHPAPLAQPVAAPLPQAESITDYMMNLVDRLGHEASEVDARAWEHLLVYAPKQAQQVAVLEDIEQYRVQMAGISTAALGYWSEGDEIHPDYDTTALRDVARLYSKYDQLFKEKEVRRAQQVAVPVPMADDQMSRLFCRSSEVQHPALFSTYKCGVRDAEAHHGITPQGDKP
jgi:hypothetical protein